MRVLFVTNQAKTRFFSALGRHLQTLGAEVYFVSVSQRWSEFLAGEGWRPERILRLHEHGRLWSEQFEPTADDIARVQRLEAASETSLKNVLIMDRELSRRPGLETEAYAYVTAREIERFVLANGIRYGFGEVTWAPEMIAAMVLAGHGGAYATHHTVRLPSERFGLFSGIFHDKLERVGEPAAEHRALAERTIADLRERGTRPYYFFANMNPERFRRHWLEEAKVALASPDGNRFDHSVPDLLTRSRRRLGTRLEARRARRSITFERAPVKSARPFALVLLHKQPEASVDVWGNAMSNQLETIRAMTRLLPFGWEVWVKEHSHAIGDRGQAYYEAICGLPGARLIDPGEDTVALMRRAGLVAAVTGTGVMEAAVLGVPAIAFGRIFFAPILLADAFDPFGASHVEFARLLREGQRRRGDPAHEQTIVDFMTDIIAQSEVGLISDPQSNPECLEPANIERVARFTLRWLEARRARELPAMAAGERA